MAVTDIGVWKRFHEIKCYPFHGTAHVVLLQRCSCLLACVFFRCAYVAPHVPSVYTDTTLCPVEPLAHLPERLVSPRCPPAGASESVCSMYLLARFLTSINIALLDLVTSTQPRCPSPRIKFHYIHTCTRTHARTHTHYATGDVFFYFK